MKKAVRPLEENCAGGEGVSYYGSSSSREIGELRIVAGG